VGGEIAGAMSGMNVVNDKEFGRRVIQNIMDIFISPEVQRRQNMGELPKPLDLLAAQVILFPDERKPLVRINSEVRAIAKVKYKPGITKKKGDTIYDNEIEGIGNVKLGPDDDPDCGHIFLYRLGGGIFLHFDFRRNKALATQHVERAREFHHVADHSLRRGNLSAFVDNAFSAAELSAKAVLLVMYDYEPSLRVKAKHTAIHARYNRFANLGNVMPEYKKTFNRLSGLREAARYLKRPLSIAEEEAHEMLDVVGKMIEDAKSRVR
jgi:uncharacterized protein (UPF0332 family)